MKRFLCLASVVSALLLCSACGNQAALAALQAQVTALEQSLAESEKQRINDAYDFQRQLEVLTSHDEQMPPRARVTVFPTRCVTAASKVF